MVRFEAGFFGAWGPRGEPERIRHVVELAERESSEVVVRSKKVRGFGGVRSKSEDELKVAEDGVFVRWDLADLAQDSESQNSQRMDWCSTPGRPHWQCEDHSMRFPVEPEKPHCVVGLGKKESLVVADENEREDVCGGGKISSG